ncbi:hypothetical protein DUNSADRAFT_1549 [Dunaliella salina]|uniref:Rhodanese domain-containing protein n=1 Tax=Dunaliella salina TaxID=3046 RepID=A0ABQ7FXA6_DUNSA|nr:hypothetical protein DUNSADRAFT_1549 [Dunaliella salina]|eukprot:KAF5826993.1 hypothetical protein DUNSADRAFT_1549 [Dunaliella salina]
MLALSSPLYKSLQHRPSLCWRKQSRPAARVRTGAMIGNTNAAKVQQIKEMYSKNKASFPDVPDMSCEEVASVALQANNKPLIIIDTRTQEEQQVSMLPGPVLTQEEFEQKQEEFKQHEVVCYCTIGMRSGLLAKRLREQGFSAYNLEGSILGWVRPTITIRCWRRIGGPKLDEYMFLASSGRYRLKAMSQWHSQSHC